MGSPSAHLIEGDEEKLHSYLIKCGSNAYVHHFVTHTQINSYISATWVSTFWASVCVQMLPSLCVCKNSGGYLLVILSILLSYLLLILMLPHRKEK